jgi:hypothetical protein
MAASYWLGDYQRNRSGYTIKPRLFTKVCEIDMPKLEVLERDSDLSAIMAVLVVELAYSN